MVPVYVEIPNCLNVKYALDKTLDILRVDRVLCSAEDNPANYGFVPPTEMGRVDPPISWFWVRTGRVGPRRPAGRAGESE